MADDVIVEDFYEDNDDKLLSGQGFFQRITIPPGACTEFVEYTRPYIVYPLTKGRLEIEMNGERSIEELEIGRTYARKGSSEERIKIRVCNPDEYGPPIIILKG